MGQTLSAAITDKESSSEAVTGPLRLSWAATCMQGWRTGMEDAHICMPSVTPHQHGPWSTAALFGVLDGHGGEQVAKFSSLHLPELLSECSFKAGKQAPKGDLELALRNAFHSIDDMLRDSKHAKELQSLTNPPTKQLSGVSLPSKTVDVHGVGCTACVCCITEHQLVTANAGDSRAVLCRNGKAIALSEDHKPNDPRERKRIEAAGGYIECCGPGQFRVNGNLNLSRALGDLDYKRDTRRPPEEQIISATPDVTFFDRDMDADEFVVVCCDGVWDVKTNQQVVDFLRERFTRDGRAPDDKVMEAAVEELLDACVSKDLRLTRGLGGDNMTAVVVWLKPPPQQKEDDKVKEVTRSLPHLITADLVDSSYTNGWLQVDVALPCGVSSSDVSIGVSEKTAQLEVVVRNDASDPDDASSGSSSKVNSEIFDLAQHLPKGSALFFSHEPEAIVFRMLGRLRLWLGWQRTQ
eukprot:TRINITY_DN12507_c0_g1_i1.p1 TRINITY_DN12507_c0_g1~~TRINITY_DN12507_c0_g1_i1.p1  ORF type:complete len:466 (-),score=75.61 TRINITY_DN12507_c0_g1_i1:60-1457(-)